MSFKYQKSQEMFQIATKLIPGGVNSPVRSFKSVKGSPIFIERGAGQYIFDVDGNKYIDFIGSWGPLILGHCHHKVIDAISQQLKKGLSFGASNEHEIKLATIIQTCMPSIEMIRMVNSGTEACMSAIRLARGYTKKNKIIKFVGCYHGHSDYLLAKAGSGLLTNSVPDSVGVPLEFVQHTLTAPFNDLKSAQALLEQHKDDVAAIIIEPIVGNMNLILPETNFLHGLRKLCTDYKSLLIFDEVITGFRVDIGGAQALYNVKPDLTCLGKIIGGGLPVGAFGGKKEIMEYLAPLGPVYQAGTLSGNPLAMISGFTTIQELMKHKEIYRELEQKGKILINGLINALKNCDIEVTGNAVGGLFGFQFNNDHKNETFNNFFHYMLENGVYFAPSAYEAGFISICHTYEDIEYVIDKAKGFRAIL